MTKIKIIWCAFEGSSSATVTDDSWYLNDEAVLEMLFRDTNIYSGPLWDVIEPVLPKNRTHTALSVGDIVEVNDVAYRCESVGWAKI